PGNGTTGGEWITLNGKLIFKGDSDGTSANFLLWSSDGTADGTFPLGGATGNFKHQTISNGKLFYLAEDGPLGEEWWATDGSPAGTYMVKDLTPGSTSGLRDYLVDVNGTLFFRAKDGVHGFELWKSDGTEAGTTMVKDINPAMVQSGGDSSNPICMIN